MLFVANLHRILQSWFHWLKKRLSGGPFWILLPGKAAGRVKLQADLLGRLDEHSREVGRPLESLLPGMLRAAYRSCEQPDPVAVAWERLTERERQVARLMAQGLSNQAIAARLMISRNTVRTHARRVLAKFGCQSRLELPDLPGYIRRPD